MAFLLRLHALRTTLTTSSCCTTSLSSTMSSPQSQSQSPKAMTFSSWRCDITQPFVHASIHRLANGWPYATPEFQLIVTALPTRLFLLLSATLITRAYASRQQVPGSTLPPVTPTMTTATMRTTMTMATSLNSSSTSRPSPPSSGRLKEVSSLSPATDGPFFLLLLTGQAQVASLHERLYTRRGSHSPVSCLTQALDIASLSYSTTQPIDEKRRASTAKTSTCLNYPTSAYLSPPHLPLEEGRQDNDLDDEWDDSLHPYAMNDLRTTTLTEGMKQLTRLLNDLLEDEAYSHVGRCSALAMEATSELYPSLQSTLRLE